MHIKGNTFMTHVMCIAALAARLMCLMHIKCVRNVLPFMRILMRIAALNSHTGAFGLLG